MCNKREKEAMMIDKFMQYLNDGDLVEEVVAANGKDTYLMPARRNAGHIAMVVIREIVAPTVFRNAEEEITDIEDRDGVRRVRATPSKFKFGERGRGLLVLRAWNAGGRLPQNRTAVGDRMPIRDAFDLNTLVFGDSAMWGTRVLPVKAAVQYSDALSTVPYRDGVGESFHHRGDETGTLWDAEGKKNTEICSPATSSCLGLFWFRFSLAMGANSRRSVSITCCSAWALPAPTEARPRSPASMCAPTSPGCSPPALRLRCPLPYELLRSLPDSNSVEEVASAVVQTMSEHYRVHADTHEACAYQQQLVKAFEEDDPDLRKRYQQAAPKIADLFEQHFTSRRA